MNSIKNLCIDKIKKNISNNLLMASPSFSPPYRFYWIRDAGIVYRSLIQYYKNKPNNEILVLLLKYIENEKKIQNLDTLSGSRRNKNKFKFYTFQ